MEKVSFLRNIENASTNDFVKDGKLHENAQITSVMVESSSDLESLEGYFPGSVAYTAGFTSMWQLDADGQWVSII